MLSQRDKAIICRLQEDIPIVSNPFKVMADELEMEEEELLNKIQEFYDQGFLRRVGVVLHHRKAGFAANAMVVWVAPVEKIREIGSKMASFQCISHCYQRRTYPDWPYNLFTMVHARTFEECGRAIAQIAEAVQIKEFEVLYSTHEMKKSRMKYFE